MNNFENTLVETTTAADIESRPVNWLFEPYFPLETVSILLGDGGQGKSFVSLAIAAAVTRGTPLFGAKTAIPPSDVIIQNSENAWASVIKPRLEMLGADCSRVHFINDSDKPLTLADERIEAAIRKHNAKFFIADPVQAFLGDSFSMNRAESVRPMITHLVRVAERTKSAILLVGHVSKGRGKAQHRGLGSVDFINSVPSAVCLGQAEGYDSDVRVLAHLKSNFAPLAPSQSFRLNTALGFKWLGECDATPDDILNFDGVKSYEKFESGSKSKLDEAVDFLTDLLADGEITAVEAVEQADEMGISRKTLERARDAVGVQSKRVNGHWVWSLE